MLIKRTIKFSVQNQQNAESRIGMRVTYNGHRVDFQTGILLDKKSWDNIQQHVIPLNTNIMLANDLNEHLSQMRVDMVSVFREFELRQIVPSPTELRTAFHFKTNPQRKFNIELQSQVRV